MFYRPEDGHGLPHNPFNAIVTPRPIGWISSRSADGVNNLAPYSFFNAIAYTPPQVMFSSTGAKPDHDTSKDSMNNIRETGMFCVNVVEYAARDAMNAYDAEILFADWQMGKLLDALRERERWNRTLIVVAGDHGEGLGQHGVPGHGQTWNEQVHAPLVMRIPGVSPRREPGVISTMR